MELILKDGYYVDSNNNKWSADKYSHDEAIKANESLVNCKDCVNCVNCFSCISCYDCMKCARYALSCSLCVCMCIFV